MLFLGSDHRGFELKEKLKEYFKENNIEFIDCGTNSKEIAHYPLIAKNVISQMDTNKDKAILICGSGIGMAMVANKFKGIRAGLCSSAVIAEEAKQHNDINVLTLASDWVTYEEAIDIIVAWKNAEPLGGRYQERKNMLEEIEKENMK